MGITGDIPEAYAPGGRIPIAIWTENAPPPTVTDGRNER